MIISIIFVLLIEGGFSYSTYGNISMSWTTLPQTLPEKLYAITTGVWNNSVYVIGGRQDSGTYSLSAYSIHQQDLFTSNSSSLWTAHQAWQNDSQYGAIDTIFCTACFTTVNNLIYIIGPSNDATGLMLIYDMNTQSQIDSLSYEYQLPHFIRYPCTTNNGTHIFSFGGYNDTQTYNFTQIYSIDNDKWFVSSDNGSLHYARQSSQCVYIEDFEAVYVFSGINADGAIDVSYTDVEIYDTNNDAMYRDMSNSGVLDIGRRHAISSKIKLFDDYWLVFITGGTNRDGGASSDFSTNTTEVFIIESKYTIQSLNTSNLANNSDIISFIDDKPNGESLMGWIQLNDSFVLTMGGIAVTSTETVFNKIDFGRIVTNVDYNTFEPTNIPTSIPTMMPTNNPTSWPSHQSTSVNSTITGTETTMSTTHAVSTTTTTTASITSSIGSILSTKNTQTPSISTTSVVSSTGIITTTDAKTTNKPKGGGSSKGNGDQVMQMIIIIVGLTVGLLLLLVLVGIVYKQKLNSELKMEKEQKDRMHHKQKNNTGQKNVGQVHVTMGNYDADDEKLPDLQQQMATHNKMAKLGSVSASNHDDENENDDADDNDQELYSDDHEDLYHTQNQTRTDDGTITSNTVGGTIGATNNRDQQHTIEGIGGGEEGGSERTTPN